MPHDVRPRGRDSDYAVRDIGDVPATIDWMQRLRKLKVSKAVPLLIMRLDRLSRAELDPKAKLGLLHLLKRPVLKMSAVLPRPDPRLPAGGFDATSGLTAEQRLDKLMRENLKQLFQSLDRNRFTSDVATEDNRHWVLRNLFKFTRRQVRYAFMARRDCPANTWQELHDLFVYLVIRGNVRLDDSLRVDFFDDGFDAETEYKRLLLMGYAQRFDLPGVAILDMISRLAAWSQESRLSDPGAHLGLFEQLLVEVSRDRPLRINDGSLNETFRGWVMLPARGYVKYLQHVGQDRSQVYPKYYSAS